MIDSIQRFRSTLAIFRNVKYAYFSYYKPIGSKKFEKLVGYYTSLQHVYLFAENTLILQLAILLDENEKFSIIKAINCLLTEKEITTDNSITFKEKLQIDTEVFAKIKDFRDKYVSHLDFKAIQQIHGYISDDQYETLFQTIQNTLESIMKTLQISESLELIARIGMEATLDNLVDYVKIKFKMDV